MLGKFRSLCWEGGSSEKGFGGLHCFHKSQNFESKLQQKSENSLQKEKKKERRDQISKEANRTDLKNCERMYLQHHLNLSDNRERCHKECKQESVRGNQTQNLESNRESVKTQLRSRTQAIGWMEELEKNFRIQALNVQISCSCDHERSILGSCC